MAISGTLVGQGLAQATDVGFACAPIPYTIIQPAKTGHNINLIQLEIFRWTAIVKDFDDDYKRGRVPIEVPARAEFAVDVLKTIAMNLDLGVCCGLLATTIDDHILGALNYTPIPPNEATLNLLAVDPRNVPGAPLSPKYRGVGTAMVAALASLLTQNGYTTIFLHPLDDAAETFWRGRGFDTCGKGGLLCVRGKDRISSLVEGCLTREDNPQDGHIVLCGLPKRVREKLLAR